MIEDLKREKIVCKLLSKVFVDKAYGSIELNKALHDKRLSDEDNAYITKLFYGVIEKSIQFDYIIESLTNKFPKPSVAQYIKIGLYLLRYMSVPDYAAVNKTVSLVKEMGKHGVAGFVNAVLKKSIKFKLPDIKNNKTLSINTSVPLWIVDLLVQQNDFEFVKALLCFEQSNLTHIRINQNHISKGVFENKYPFLLENTSQYGYYVTHTTIKKLEKTDYIIQSLASCIAVNSYINDEKSQLEILDLCAAPGGKSIYLKQLLPESSITACDVHEHRVELIRKYSKNTNTNINIIKNDATILRPEFIDKFDIVICDAPCSGIGVYGSKPEIVFNKTIDDIKTLSQLQLKILENASKYLKNKGTLCYSTCTILRQENEDIIEAFLENNKNFSKKRISLENFCSNSNDFVKLYPFINNCDGFFIAKLTKN